MHPNALSTSCVVECLLQMWVKLEDGREVDLSIISNIHVQIQNWTCFNLSSQSSFFFQPHLAGHYMTLECCYRQAVVVLLVRHWFILYKHMIVTHL